MKIMPIFPFSKWRSILSLFIIFWSFLQMASMAATSGNKNPNLQSSITSSSMEDFFFKILHFLWQSDQSGYQHIWPEMKFDWPIIVGTIIGFFGAAFGSVGGVGGGGIFVPMLSLIIGFDIKSSTAISKCMITGAAISAVYYNLKLRHPTLDMPIIDYDLALLFQPMLMLGISIGVGFNVTFAHWMITVLLIILFLATSTRACLKGIETWKKETLMLKEIGQHQKSHGATAEEVDYDSLPDGPHKEAKDSEVPILEKGYSMEIGLLVFVWVTFLALQIAKEHTATCSVGYWVLNLLQIPVAVGVTLFEAVSLYKGKRTISSTGSTITKWKMHKLLLYCFCGILAGIVGGLLGLGGGFILAPLFLHLGVPPQVSSATATFAMAFSSSMSVAEYYLLKRFPISYALYFVIVATIAACIGQHVVRKMIFILGRASLIIFILAFTIFVSAISLGGVGISKMVDRFERHEYMGFQNLCKYNM